MLPRRLDVPLRIVVLLIVLGIGFASYRSWRQTQNTIKEWVHARDRLSATNELISALKDAETGQRGFLLTGSEQYLEPYTKATAAMPHLMDEVTRVADRGGLVSKSKLLRRLINDKLAELQTGIILRREKGLDAAMEVVRSNAGKATMDSIRTLSSYMTAQETDLLMRQRRDMGAFAFRSFWLTAAGLGALLLVLVLQERAVDRGIQARDHLVGELDQAGEKLKVTLLSIGDAVIACDENGRITLMNSVAEELTGWRLAEAGGQLIESVFNIVNEETRLMVENPATKALRTGKPVELANHTVLIGKQGQETPIDDIGAPIRDR